MPYDYGTLRSRRDLDATIHRNLDFVIGVDTKNARLSEADSKARSPHQAANNALSPVRAPQD